MFQSSNKNSLRQGEQFDKMREMYRQNIKHIGKNNYNGIREGATSQEKMQEYYDAFETTLDEYEDAYNRKLNYKRGDLSDYNGKTITYDDSIYFVTKKGVLRELSGIGTTSTVEEKITRHQCPLVATNNNPITKKIFDKLNGRKGPPIICNDSTEVCQKCGDRVVKNGSAFVTNTGAGGRLYWVNDSGYKQLFNQDVYKKDTHDTCPKNRDTLSMSADKISLIPNHKTKPTLLGESPCTGFLYGDGSVIELNSKLIRLAINMKKEIETIQNSSATTDGEIGLANKSLNLIIANLSEKRDSIKNLKKEIQSLDGNIMDNTHLVKSINLRYIAWVLSFVTILLLGVYKIKK
jgi:hypothetical protein